MSQFVVSARKYRPTTFDEVVGQNHVAKTLKNALQTDQLAHAFLFCGPRGVGKTTCARILAKVINCQNSISKVEPCNECSSCKSFNDNASFNIFELDAASNNSVDHIRNLIEQVRFQPQQGTHKVFIIDEVHMLSTQAFNAFLKTLEEPPPYAIFILATTEKHKILPTILSRCQIFDFKRIQPDDIVEQLEYICKAENRAADGEALHQIAQKADGAMRDALSIYDKIASAAPGKISYQDVVINLNLLDYDYFFKTIDACLRNDLTSLLLILDDIVKSGFESEIYVQGLAEHLRDLLVSRDPKTIALMEGSRDLKMRYYNQSQITSESFILSALNLLNTCDLSLPRANNKRLQIELALAKMCYLGNTVEKDLFVGQNLEKKTPILTDNIVPSAILISEPETTIQPLVQQQNITPESISDLEEVMDVEYIDNGIEEETQDEDIVYQDDNDFDIEESNEMDEELLEVVDDSAPTEDEGENESILDDLDIDIPLAIKGGTNHLDLIKKKIRAEEKEQKAAQSNLTLESVMLTWDNYVSNHSSPSFQAAMKHIILELDEKVLKVIVPSPVAQGFIIQETDLMDQIRDEFGTPDLTLQLDIDKDQFPDIEEEEVIKTYFSRSEALEELSKKNPQLVELMKRFELRPDDGH